MVSGLFGCLILWLCLSSFVCCESWLDSLLNTFPYCVYKFLKLAWQSFSGIADHLYLETAQIIWYTASGMYSWKPRRRDLTSNSTRGLSISRTSSSLARDNLFSYLDLDTRFEKTSRNRKGGSLLSRVFGMRILISYLSSNVYLSSFKLILITKNILYRSRI